MNAGAKNPGIEVRREGAVAVVELQRPDVLNAIDIAMRRALFEALTALGRDPEVVAVVLSGAGRMFCAGADLKGGSKGTDETLRSASRVLAHDYHPVLECLTKMDKPVIAAINGGAVGVGMSLALACDLVVMEQSAYMLTGLVNVGLVPDGGVAWFLSRRIGYGRTYEVLADAQKLDAERCLALGLANRVVADGQGVEEAIKWGASFAARAPMALALTKRLVRLSETVSLADSMAIEAEMQTLCTATEDAQEAMAAFVEKRKPIFTGR